MSGILFLKLMIEKMTPAVMEIEAKKGSGHFRIEYSQGEFKRVKQEKTL